ncbi:MAG: hypothetical protein ACK4GT_07795 [Pararhodobacter sp.]
MPSEFGLLETYETLWLFGTPLEHRDALTAALSDFDLHFPSVHSVPETIIARMAGAAHSLALFWRGSELPGTLTDRISEHFACAVLAPSLFRLPVGFNLAPIGYQVMSLSAEHGVKEPKLLTEARIAEAEADGDLMARAGEALRATRRSIP